MPKVETVPEPKPSIKKYGEVILGIIALAGLTFSFVQAVDFYRFLHGELFQVIVFDMKNRLPEIQSRFDRLVEERKKSNTPPAAPTVTSTTLPPEVKK